MSDDESATLPPDTSGNRICQIDWSNPSDAVCSTQSSGRGANRACTACRWLTSERCSIITPFGRPVDPDVWST
jgi:hypothetical protein